MAHRPRLAAALSLLVSLGCGGGSGSEPALGASSVPGPEAGAGGLVHALARAAAPESARPLDGDGGATLLEAGAPPLEGGKVSAPFRIVRTGDPVLRRRAVDVPAARLGTPELADLARDMIATMRAAPGVGLAAPQIGRSERVVVLEDRAEYVARLGDVERSERERVAFEPRVIVNPVVRAIGTETATFFEGCLSVPGYVGLVTRAREVEVRGTDAAGAPVVWRVRGWPARILQHELDHLDGTLYVDRVVPRTLLDGDEARARYAGKPIAEILGALAPPSTAPRR